MDYRPPHVHGAGGGRDHDDDGSSDASEYDGGGDDSISVGSSDSGRSTGHGGSSDDDAGAFDMDDSDFDDDDDDGGVGGGAMGVGGGAPGVHAPPAGGLIDHDSDFDDDDGDGEGDGNGEDAGMPGGVAAELHDNAADAGHPFDGLAPDRRGIDLQDDTSVSLNRTMPPADLTADRCPLCALPWDSSLMTTINEIIDSVGTHNLHACTTAIITVYQRTVTIPTAWKTAHHREVAHTEARRLTPICEEVVIAHIREHCLSYAMVNRRNINLLSAILNKYENTLLMVNGRTVDERNANMVIKIIRTMNECEKNERERRRMGRVTRAGGGGGGGLQVGR